MNHLNDGAEPMAGGAFKSAHARTVEKHGGTDSFAAAVMNIATDRVLSASVREGGPWYSFSANVVKMTVAKHALSEDS